MRNIVNRNISFGRIFTRHNEDDSCDEGGDLVARGAVATRGQDDGHRQQQTPAEDEPRAVDYRI